MVKGKHLSKPARQELRDGLGYEEAQQLVDRITAFGPRGCDALAVENAAVDSFCVALENESDPERLLDQWPSREHWFARIITECGQQRLALRSDARPCKAEAYDRKGNWIGSSFSESGALLEDMTLHIAAYVSDLRKFTSLTVDLFPEFDIAPRLGSDDAKITRAELDEWIDSVLVWATQGYEASREPIEHHSTDDPPVKQVKLWKITDETKFTLAEVTFELDGRQGDLLRRYIKAGEKFLADNELAGSEEFPEAKGNSTIRGYRSDLCAALAQHFEVIPDKGCEREFFEVKTVDKQKRFRLNSESLRPKLSLAQKPAARRPGKKSSMKTQKQRSRNV